MMSSDAEALARDANSEFNAAFRRMAIGAKRSASSLSHPSAADSRTDSPERYARNASPALRGSGAGSSAKDMASFVGGGDEEDTRTQDRDDDDDAQLATSLLRNVSTSLQQGIAPGAEPDEHNEAYYFPDHSPISGSPFHTQTSVHDPDHAQSAITRSSSGTDFTSASTTPTGNRRPVFLDETFAPTTQENHSTAIENEGYSSDHAADDSDDVVGALAQHVPALATTATRSSGGNSRRSTPRRNSINQYYNPFMMPQQYPPQGYYLPPGMGQQHQGQMVSGAGGVSISPPSIMSPPYGLTSPIQMYGVPMGMAPPQLPSHGGQQAPPGLGHQQQPHPQQQSSQQSQPMDMPMGMPMVPMGMNMGQFPNQPVPMFHQQVVPVCRYFQQGRCWAGQNCRFSHYIGPGPYIAAYPTTSGGTAFTAHPGHQPSPPPAALLSRPTNHQGRVIRCRYYVQGRCWAGPHCRFAHD
ncbi:hypothetical protein HDU88_001030 [Geranomyces variabilis]|nr:hypothetical protein HDU88_001030 [Geranomyces variabilis]